MRLKIIQFPFYSKVSFGTSRDRRYNNDYSKPDVAELLEKKNQVEKHPDEMQHAQQVEKFSLNIFDQIQKCGLADFSSYRKYLNPRKLLNLGALFHDIGRSATTDEIKHPEESYKLVKKELTSFPKKQKNIIASITRYHSGEENLDPKIKSNKYRTLTKQLTAICRLADGLDKTHSLLIKKIKCAYDKKNNVLRLLLIQRTPKPSESPEEFNEKLEKLRQVVKKEKSQLFEREFGVKIKFEWLM